MVPAAPGESAKLLEACRRSHGRFALAWRKAPAEVAEPPWRRPRGSQPRPAAAREPLRPYRGRCALAAQLSESSERQERKRLPARRRGPCCCALAAQK